MYLLTQAGYRVRAAHNGRQALDSCLDELPALVLTDLRLPGLDGFGLARELHAAFGRATPPIVAITGFVPPDDDPRLQHARFHRLLVKPVTPGLLAQAIKEALNMANVNPSSNPSKGAAHQAGHEPKQGNKREPGTPQQPNHAQHKDHEEGRRQNSSGAGGAPGKGSTETV